MSTAILIQEDLENQKLSQDNNQTRISPYYLEVEGSQRRIIRIPCVSESFAKKVLTGLNSIKVKK